MNIPFPNKIGLDERNGLVLYMSRIHGYIMVSLDIFFLISRYQSTAGGDLSMLFPLHAGFEPTFHTGSVRVGRGTIYHMILYAYVL